MQRVELLNYLNDYLKCSKFKDFTVNGMQVEGKAEIKKIVTAVTASAAAVDYACTVGADALLVHHGYFWKGEPQQITGMKQRRVAALLSKQVNLLAYHIPLDQHPKLGNNILFANHFDCQRVWQSDDEPLIWHAEITPLEPSQIANILRCELPSETVFLIEADVQQSVTRIAWCTGAAHDFLIQAKDEGAQLFISGEYAERTYHEAKESGCAFIACGHHASERAGIRALGEHLAQDFDLEVSFFDEPNPF
ncbi:Nif3-like dinuclear metal center hexameric protein [Cardiobacteriaceae bacterium TAE3-ERU3]|nr:Nif3-like dinuclear metal center hexameric protein [Cardiobacteriaceae bacterium TAE3-ERU3]